MWVLRACPKKRANIDLLHAAFAESALDSSQAGSGAKRCEKAIERECTEHARRLLGNRSSSLGNASLNASRMTVSRMISSLSRKNACMNSWADLA